MEQHLAALNSTMTAGMYFPTGTNGNECAYIAGRPLRVLEQCPALGLTGDLICFDPTQYLIVERDNSVALSVDCLFLSGQPVFKFIYRVDAKGLVGAPYTPFNSTVIRSPYVTLAPRP
jgi:HK97 family phage major capsid protein